MLEELTDRPRPRGRAKATEKEREACVVVDQTQEELTRLLEDADGAGEGGEGNGARDLVRWAREMGWCV